MAKIISPVWSRISGSIAGTTYFTTAAGQIIGRQRTMPVNSPTNFKNYIRNALQTRAAHWTALSAAQRTAWLNWALANGWTNGRLPYMSGTVLLQFIDNTGLAGAVTGLSDNAPDTNNTPQVTVVPTAPAAAGTDAVAVKIRNEGPQRIYAYVEISPQFSPARMYWKGPWVPTMAKAFSINSGVTPITEFAGLVVGMKYFMRVRVVTADATAGLRGNRVNAPTIISAVAVHVP